MYPTNTLDKNTTKYNDIDTLFECDLPENCHPVLFLDIDGTLADFQLNPADSFIPTSTLYILEKIIQQDIPVIAVTGRDLLMAQALFGELDIPVASLHGLEIYIDKDTSLNAEIDNKVFISVYKELKEACEDYPELLIENKTNSIALHYRRYPQLEATAKRIMQGINHKHPELKLIDGKFVYELIFRQANKGISIQKILDHLDISCAVPVFIGDDRTDEDGFAIINKNHGVSIKVGEGETCAHYRLKNTHEVAEFLKRFLEQTTRSTSNKTSSLEGEEYV